MGLGFRVGSGVRVYGGGRGLGVSVGKGPVRYYHHFGGGRSSRGGGQASVAAYQRQLRQAQRLEEIQGVLDLDKQLIAMCQAHLQDFDAAQQPVAPTPDPVDRQEVQKRLEAESLSGISLMKLNERRAAKRDAQSRVEAEILAEEERRASEAETLQRDLDEHWERLKANDPDVVLTILEQAFEDNEAPAAAVSCREARVDVVVRWPSLDEVVPEHKGAVTPSGNPTIHKRNKTERAEFYLEALSSHALATAKEAFAVCPGIQEIGLGVVRSAQDPARGDAIVEPIVLGLLQREQLDRVQWQNINATAAFLQNASGRIGMKGKGANKTLLGLDLSDEPDERSFIAQVAEGLDARVPEDGVSGIALPVQVVVGA